MDTYYAVIVPIVSNPKLPTLDVQDSQSIEASSTEDALAEVVDSFLESGFRVLGTRSILVYLLAPDEFDWRLHRVVFEVAVTCEVQTPEGVGYPATIPDTTPGVCPEDEVA